MAKDTMNIAFCFDQNYALGYLVTMVSLFENNKGEDIKVYVITPGLPQNINDKFNKLAEIYNQKVVYKVMEPSMFEGLPINPPFNVATYFRYTIPVLCEEHKLLQLDGDLIVRKNIRSLYDTDVTDVAMAVVEDQCSDEIQSKNRLQLDTPIFNNGVQLMNLDYWRENKIADLCKKFMIEHPERCRYMDQDANNVILQGKVKFMPYTYNFQGLWFNPKLKLFMHRSKWEEIDSCISDPAIVHFSGYLKPWFYGCDNPFTPEFDKYAKLQGFIGYKKLYKHSWLYRATNYLLSGIRNKLLHIIGN